MNQKKMRRGLAVIVISALAVSGLAASAKAAVVPISLGKASGYGVIAGGGLVNNGQSKIIGDLGISPVISYVDNGALVIKGDYHFGDPGIIAAQADLTNAYNLASSETPTVTVPVELSGQTLFSGIYTNTSGFTLNGTLNFDAQNNPNALFIMKSPVALTTGAASKINLLNGAQACNIFWQVATTSSLGTNSDFKGNLLGKGAFVSGSGTIVQGRVLIGSGSVTLNTTQITRPDCKVVKTPITNNFGVGAGSYTSQYGKSTFAFVLKGTDTGNGTYSNVDGRVGWNVNKNWNFTGTPNTYTYSAGVGTIAGTGTLRYYSKPKNAKTGRWINATTGAANFTIKYTRLINSNGSFGKVDTFAIGFTGTQAPGAPQLPVLGALVKVKGGDSDD